MGLARSAWSSSGLTKGPRRPTHRPLPTHTPPSPPLARTQTRWHVHVGGWGGRAVAPHVGVKAVVKRLQSAAAGDLNAVPNDSPRRLAHVVVRELSPCTSTGGCQPRAREKRTRSTTSARAVRSHNDAMEREGTRATRLLACLGRGMSVHTCTWRSGKSSRKPPKNDDATAATTSAVARVRRRSCRSRAKHCCIRSEAMGNGPFLRSDRASAHAHRKRNQAP